MYIYVKNVKNKLCVRVTGDCRTGHVIRTGRRPTNSHKKVYTISHASVGPTKRKNTFDDSPGDATLSYTHASRLIHKTIPNGVVWKRFGFFLFKHTDYILSIYYIYIRKKKKKHLCVYD